jgi:hypothetical protein
MKGTKKTMWIILTVITILIVGITIFFNIPYSKTKSEFNKTVTETIRHTSAVSDIFTLDDIKGLPLPVRKYFDYCGYIGTPKMSFMKVKFKNVGFVLSPDKPKLKIDYTQYNFAQQPIRIAFIDTAMYGIPFQGLDSYVDGVGGMKGVIAKTITLFNEVGKEMDRACLVTVLSECLIIPNVALQNYIAWEAIDDTHAKATISYYGISASGIFTFSESGEMLSFTTNDRTNTAIDGTSQQVAWSAILSDYKDMNGIKQPTILQAIWHYESGDLLYFDSDNVVIEYH